MKIFIAASWYPSDFIPNSGSFFRERAKILQKNHEVTILAGLVFSFRDFLAGKRIPKKKGVFNENELQVYRSEKLNVFPKMQRLTFLRYKKDMISLFRNAIKEQGKPDLVFIFSSLWAGAALSDFLAEQKISYIVSEHLKEFILPNTMNRLYRKSVNVSYKNAAKIIATSSAIQKAIENQFPSALGKTTIIPNPADISAFRVNQKSNSPDMTFNLLCIAHLRWEKRIEDLLEAMAEVVKTNRNIHLNIAGDGELRSDLEKIRTELALEEFVTFVGHQDKVSVNKLIGDCHALILTSEVETFGVVLVEAMACGKPVIASRCGGPEDIVSRETGVLVEPRNIQQIADAILEMMGRYSEFSADKIRKIADERYSDDAFIRNVETVWDEIQKTA